ncbi:uncharacterized protein LOC62_05G006923 [Vanrija pseudolonga]|uniref:BZIP domain-containing protein n=1 Tax=Vanrija pseudolonga TaxID=143232 RepID=A0AAF1BK12_9TREE|nr:hypothetical protein LOC62_05G006923 [Vanrija pseudolonga]
MDADSASQTATASATTPSQQPQKDRHEPRGRKPNDQLPPSRAREVQRAFRLRRAEHLAALEERIMILEGENNQLRALLSLPEADRGKIGSGPTGRGKSLKDGGVPMSERVRARKEARERERRARGLPARKLEDVTDSEDDDSSHSPSVNSANQRSTSASGGGGVGASLAQAVASAAGIAGTASTIPLFSSPGDLPAPYSFNLPTPFQLPISPEPHFDYNAANLDFKNAGANSFPIFNMFDAPSGSDGNSAQQPTPGLTPAVNEKPSPLSPPSAAAAAAASAAASTSTSQPDLLTRLKACCHLSDSHVVNDPGLLIFATRLCQSFACPFGGSHPNSAPSDDPEQMLLEDAWRSLKATLDPGGEADGENRINTGRMAAELVVRAAASRGQGNWIVCRYKDGMTIKRALVLGLVQGFGGKIE